MVIYVPIGIDCGVAECLKKHNLRTIALPFDWIVTYQGITNIIKNDFINFFPDLSKSVIIDDMPNVFNDNYGIKFIHDKFPDVDVYDKYIRRINRFKEILKTTDDTVIFIKKGHAYHNHKEYPLKDDIEDINELDELLKTKYPNLKYKIVLTLLCYNCYKNKINKIISNHNVIVNSSLITNISSKEIENKLITGYVYNDMFKNLIINQII